MLMMMMMMMMIEYFLADGVSKTKTPLSIKNKKHKIIYEMNFSLSADKKGLCLCVMNHVGIEKSTTGTKSFTNLGSYQNRDNSNSDLQKSSLQPMRKEKNTHPRQKKKKNGQKRIVKKFYK